MITRYGKCSLSYLIVLSLLLSSCAAVRPRKVSEKAGVRSIQAGPPVGFTIKQGLTSVTEVVWKLDVRDEADLERSRKSGLKVFALYEVVERSGDRAKVQVTLEKAEVLKEGKFVQSPLMQYNPPNPLLFTVDYASKKIDFSSLEKSYEDWAKGLQETPVWDMMGGSFDLPSFVPQLERLLAAPVVEFSGISMQLGEDDVVREEISLPFLGPAVSPGSFSVEQKRGMRGVLDLGGREIAMIEGEQFSDRLSMGTDALAGRMGLFGRLAPDYFESMGELAAKYQAKVDTATGWTVETSRRFRSVIIVNFENGSLREDIMEKKSFYEL